MNNEYQIFFDVGVAVIGAMGGWILNTVWNAVKELQKADKELAEKVFLSSDGVGSSLRRMYAIFDIQESKYMKIGLLLKTIKISNHS